MPYVKLSDKAEFKYNNNDFTEGTLIMHTSLMHIYDYSTYKPIGNCVDLINKWNEQGAEIVYCTSRKEKQVAIIADILKRMVLWH